MKQSLQTDHREKSGFGIIKSVEVNSGRVHIYAPSNPGADFVNLPDQEIQELKEGDIFEFFVIKDFNVLKPQITRVIESNDELLELSRNTRDDYFRIHIEYKLKTGILNLGHCGLTSWPEDVFKMTWLEVLIMGDNTIWDGKNRLFVEKRENISFETQNYLDHIPNEIKSLQSLKVFSIGGDYVKYYPINSTGGLRGLNNLEKLDLSFCRFESVTEFSGLQNLHYLDLSDNLISSPEIYGVFENLKILKLANNKISDIKFFDGFSSLIEIDLSKNNINKIENIEFLKKIRHFNISHNKITKIQGFENKINPESLEFLDLSWNQIKEIEGLESLTKLNTLWLRNNQISSISGLTNKLKLEILDLSENKIVEIPKLNFLTSIKKLNLQKNIIQKIQNKNDFLDLMKKKDLELLYLKDNPFSNEPWIAKEWLIEFGNDKTKILERLDEFLNSSDLFKSEYQPPIKIILLGNSGAGKSTLALSLIQEKIPSKDEREGSTHGLKIRNWKEANAVIYDFGGQDYYHAVYNVFFTNQTQYIVIWNDRTNFNGLNNSNGSDPFFYFDHRYWLGNINYYLNDKDSTNRIALFNTFSPNTYFYLENEDAINYKIDQFYPVTFPLDGDIKIPELQFQIVHLATKNGLLGLKNENGYHKLELELMQKVANGLEDYKDHTRPLSRKEFFKSFNVNEIELKNSSIDQNILLSLLHHRGLIYRMKGKTAVQDKIWVNPESLNKAIHEKLSKERLLNTNGIIKESEIHDFFDVDILAVMEETQLIFKHQYGESSGDLKVEYILPQYLPLTDGSALYDLATSDMSQSFILKFFDFIPQGMMSRLICRFGLQPDNKYFYRYEIVFTISSIKAKVKIKIDMVNMTIEVHLVLNKLYERRRAEVYRYLFSAILGAYSREPIDHLSFDDFINFQRSSPDNNNNNNNNNNSVGSSETIKIDSVSKEFKKYIPQNMMISLDGNQFVEYKDLEQGAPNFVSGVKFSPGQQKDVQRVTLPRHIFNPFVNEISKTPKKLFISYSSKNSEFMRELATHLKTLERDGQISVWVDRMIETGTEWNDEIQKQLESADIILYLLSPHFVATPYIMDVEVKNGIDFYQHSKEQGNPVKLYFIQLMHCNWLRSFGAYQQKLDKDFLTKKLEIIEQPENHDRWMTVIDDLQSILNNS
ncbi:MAG: leucine-rich repeat domain-containing protein [Saprospiraceae bacterium]|nr:leucine-rich repeat domain-containing protein [Saprospiraceae bacterium]